MWCIWKSWLDCVPLRSKTIINHSSIVYFIYNVPHYSRYIQYVPWYTSWFQQTCFKNIYLLVHGIRSNTSRKKKEFFQGTIGWTIKFIQFFWCTALRNWRIMKILLDVTIMSIYNDDNKFLCILWILTYSSFSSFYLKIS